MTHHSIRRPPFPRLLVILALIVPAYSSSAQDLVGYKVEDEPLTKQEVRALEPVCRLIFTVWSQNTTVWYWQLRDNPILNRPEYRMAKDAPWAHHYCWAKVAEFRAYASTERPKRQHYINRIHGNIDFCITNGSPANWPYLPLMYVMKAKAYRMERKNVEAIEAVHQALKLYPEYEGAYFLLGEIYAEMGMDNKALEVITEGLRRNPDSQLLGRRFSELSGGKPHPAPYAPKDDDPEPGGAATKPSHPENSTSDSTASGKNVEAASRARESSASPPREEQDQYCRFCPKEDSKH